MVGWERCGGEDAVAAQSKEWQSSLGWEEVPGEESVDEAPIGSAPEPAPQPDGPPGLSSGTPAIDTWCSLTTSAMHHATAGTTRDREDPSVHPPAPSFWGVEPVGSARTVRFGAVGKGRTPGSPGSGGRRCSSDPPFHAQESQDDVSSNQTPSN